MDLYDEFATIVDALEGAGADYAVCGGLAVAFHGHPRFTRDIDLLVTERSLAAVKAAVAPLGYTIDSGRILFGVGTDPERVEHRVSRIEGADVFTLDLLVLAPELAKVWADRKRTNGRDGSSRWCRVRASR